MDGARPWVAGVFVPTYAVTRGQLVDCWPRHPEMVVELSWLRLAYLEAHQPGVGAVYAQSWHLRGRPGVLTAIATAIPRTGQGPGSEPLCGPGHHLIPVNLTDTDTADTADTVSDHTDGDYYPSAPGAGEYRALALGLAASHGRRPRSSPPGTSGLITRVDRSPAASLRRRRGVSRPTESTADSSSGSRTSRVGGFGDLHPAIVSGPSGDEIGGPWCR